MADSDHAPLPSPPLAATPPRSSSTKKGDLPPIGPMIADLDKSQAELMEKLQGLKLDLQNWKSKLDTQVKTYKDELLELKKELNSDLEQLTSDFKELKTTLQKQQDDITTSLRNLDLQDASDEHHEPQGPVNQQKLESSSVQEAVQSASSD